MHGLPQIQKMNGVTQPVQNFTPDVRAYIAAHPLCTITEAIKACEELPAMIEDAQVEDFDLQGPLEDLIQ